METISISREDYLKIIYKHSQEKNVNVTTSLLSKSLNISNAAVSEMSKRLSIDGYIVHEKYKGVNLTEKGSKQALRIIRRHRLWELFLMNTLGLTWDEVHDEAEVLEHHTSDFLIDKIDSFLGRPSFDPHGDPIPDVNGVLPKMPALISLSKAGLNTNYVIGRVKDKDNQVMKYLSRIKLSLGENIKVVQFFDFDQSLEVVIRKKHHILSEKVAECIYVHDLKNNNLC